MNRTVAKITGSVGEKGTNHRADVTVIQGLLNSRVAQLSPARPLKVDGICGPRTILLIKEFQKRVLHLHAPDGRIDVNGRTWHSLVNHHPLSLPGHPRPAIAVTLSGLELPAPAAKVLKQILTSAGLSSAKVTSVSRTPAEQARVMYENCKQHGASYNKRMYADAGDKVIDVYETNKAKPSDAVIQLMLKKINEIGPGKVSKHISDTHYTFDVAPSSIPAASHGIFVKAVNAHLAVSKLIPPPTDPAFHIEIPKTSPHL